MSHTGTVYREFKNAEDGVTGLVVGGPPGRYHVVLRDDDSGNCVGYVMGVVSLEEACGKAAAWAGVAQKT